MHSVPVNQMGLFDLISQAGLMAKLVLLLLTCASVICWAVIFTKRKILNKALQQNQEFMNAFWNSKNLDEIIAKNQNYLSSPVAMVFKNGVKELRKFSNESNQGMDTQKIDNVQRALIRSSYEQISDLEKNLSWLATTASAAPFVGLFGTVWGIMNSFQSIGATGAANLAVVAPGISEALITTATGIGAAIPAVIFYNYFIGQIKKISMDIECFSQDFINIVQRNFIINRKGP